MIAAAILFVAGRQLALMLAGAAAAGFCFGVVWEWFRTSIRNRQAAVAYRSAARRRHLERVALRDEWQPPAGGWQ